MAEKITLGEMKDLIRAENIAPSALFGVEELTGDPVVKGFVDTCLNETKSKLSGEYEGRKRVERDIDADKKTWEDKQKALEDENKTLKLETAKVKASELFSTKIKERKLTPHQSKYIEAKKSNFAPTDPEKLDSEVDKFLDTQVEDCKEMGKLFGVKVETVETKGGGEPGTGTGTGDVVDITPD